MPKGSSGGSAGPPGGARGRDRKPFLLRLSPDLIDELRQWSNAELRSLNAHIEYLLRDALRRRARGGSRPDRE